MDQAPRDYESIRHFHSIKLLKWQWARVPEYRAQTGRSDGFLCDLGWMFRMDLSVDLQGSYQKESCSATLLQIISP